MIINKLFILIIVGISFVFASSGEFTGWGDTILHHVADSKIVSFYGLPISKHVIMLLISAVFTLLISLLATKKYRNNMNAKPKGLSQIFEILLDFINKEIVIPNIGKSYTSTWTPVAMTLFVFILTCNLLGLIPFFEFIKWGGGGGSTATGNFSVTVALAIITFFAIIIAGIKKHGFIGHWKNMIPGGVPKPVLIILIPIEIIGMFVKPFALTMRLGANMTAGHIGMVAIFALPIILGGGISNPTNLNYLTGFFAGFVAVLLNTGIYALELIVSLVQAYVFTLLSCVFIGMAIHADH
tara:strand:+ start:1091 stop:1981 length:891 start_codon:yes stop_codon:yes gene_type:complete